MPPEKRTTHTESQMPRTGSNSSGRSPSTSAAGLRRTGMCVRGVLLAALMVLGCSSSSVTGGGGGGPQADPLTAAQALWAAKKPAGDRYVMVQRVVCFCAIANVSYRITVNGASITDVVNDRTDAPLASSSWGTFKTVAQLFDAVRAAQAKVGTLKAVEYDPTLGFPRTVSLDPILNAIDDEVSYVTISIRAAP